jgi:hypothetical protein
VSAYRKPAEIVLASEEPASRFVRANGSACTCTAPGPFWRWRVDVRPGDRWTCPHGGAWVWGRYNAYHREWSGSGWQPEVA